MGLSLHGLTALYLNDDRQLGANSGRHTPHSADIDTYHIHAFARRQELCWRQVGLQQYMQIDEHHYVVTLACEVWCNDEFFDFHDYVESDNLISTYCNKITYNVQKIVVK